MILNEKANKTMMILKELYLKLLIFIYDFVYIKDLAVSINTSDMAVKFVYSMCHVFLFEEN